MEKEYKPLTVDRTIIEASLKPTARGLYFYIASIADNLGYATLPYKISEKILTRNYFVKYIQKLEILSLIKKEYKYFKTRDGIIARKNRYKLLIERPIEIPEFALRLADEKDLTLKERGMYFTLCLMANKYGEIHGFVKDFSSFFDMHPNYVSINLRVLENLDLITRENGRIIIHSYDEVYL